MIRCSICGDAGWLPELEFHEDGWASCNSGGCGLTFPAGDFNEGDLDGFHIVDTDEDPEDVL